MLTIFWRAITERIMLHLPTLLKLILFQRWRFHNLNFVWLMKIVGWLTITMSLSCWIMRGDAQMRAAITKLTLLQKYNSIAIIPPLTAYLISMDSLNLATGTTSSVLPICQVGSTAAVTTMMKSLRFLALWALLGFNSSRVIIIWLWWRFCFWWYWAVRLWSWRCEGWWFTRFILLDISSLILGSISAWRWLDT